MKRRKRARLRKLMHAAVTPFLADAVGRFLEHHGGETFYAFALDFDPGCIEVYLSANTNALFEPTLARYQANENWGDRYRTEQGIRSLKYNNGDWGHAAFAALDLSEVKGISALEKSLDDFDAQLLECLAVELVNFRDTEVFARMRKTPDFVSFAIDHDESYTEALERMRRVLS